MDMLKVVREIGFFETGKNLVNVLDSKDIKIKAGAVMPLPSENIITDTTEIVKYLLEFGKSKYMFMSPEIVMVEKLALMDSHGEVIFLLPCDMKNEVKERIKDNLPKRMKVLVLEEPYFPESFFPGNGMIIICGYMAGDRLMVLPETYRMLEHYSGFLGKKVFVPYTETANAVRYNGWMEVNSNKFNAIWRKE